MKAKELKNTIEITEVGFQTTCTDLGTFGELLTKAMYTQVQGIIAELEDAYAIDECKKNVKELLKDLYTWLITSLDLETNLKEDQTAQVETPSVIKNDDEREACLKIVQAENEAMDKALAEDDMETFTNIVENGLPITEDTEDDM